MLDYFDDYAKLSLFHFHVFLECKRHQSLFLYLKNLPLYIKFYQGGIEFPTFKWNINRPRKPKFKVKINDNVKPSSAGSEINQAEVDAILDKISKSGYNSLSKKEKEILFKASKK